MSGSCDPFRARLERYLLGAPAAEEMRELSWHEHLLSCADCRELLEAEHALEALLLSLPEPRLPAELARRVVARLRAVRAADEAALDSLLALDPSASPPGDLARAMLDRLAAERRSPDRILSGAQGMRHASLDEILDLGGVVAVPAALAERVLAGLAGQRRAPRVLAVPRRTSPRWAIPIAAGILGLVGWAVWRGVGGGPGRDSAEDRGGEIAESVGERPAVAGASSEPEPELLAALDVLEEWDLLMADDIDLLLSTLEPVDVLLLDFADPETTAEDEG